MRASRSARWESARESAELALAWRSVCAAVPGAFRLIDTVSGPTTITPRIGQLSAGPPTSFVVELLPGQLAEDLRDAARRLAPSLGARSVRVVQHGLTHVRVELLTSDPLTDTVTSAVDPVASALQPLTLGIGEDGQPVPLNLGDAAHIVVQGSTGSGKSVGQYSMLGQLARARDV
ncbi:MAG TPA: FtsK/SpoIIIE domain-containing protein, partial [Pseudonocardia sp.]